MIFMHAKSRASQSEKMTSLLQYYFAVLTIVECIDCHLYDAK